MATARFRFHGALSELLAPARRQVEFEHAFDGRPGVKDVIEALGVSHAEVGRILVDGRAVTFGERLDDGAVVEVEPWPGDAGLSPEESARFVLDGHLGRLARYLRMLGFDSRYRPDVGDDELAAASAAEDRILLTRDRALLRRGSVRRGLYLRSDDPAAQIRELVARLGLAGRATPFPRCIRCNGLLEAATYDEVVDRLEPLTKRYYRDFRRCPECDAIYWKGSHHARMSRLIEAILGQRAG